MNLKTPAGFDFFSGEAPIHWDRLGAPALLIFRASIKTVTGARLEDVLVREFVAAAKARALPYGLYHVLRPNSIAEQVSLYLDVWDACGGSSTRPIVDVEVDPRLYNVGYAAWAYQVKVWLDAVEKYTAQIPIIYTSQYYWGFTYSNGVPPNWTDRYPLWVAWYPYHPDDFTAPPLSVWPGGWTKWAMWQYEDQGRTNGFEANDLNLLSAWYAAELGTVPPPVEKVKIVEASWQ